ncbi:MAG: SUMF1/EgtB/PvdO family nonheme iron enzyme [Bacteroidales bacterium]|nr:SUMF1/EgtB/PvdO family nonheme iron enzyme [Bacteroidales bacterium]
MKLFNILFIVVFAIATVSCKKEYVITYVTENQQDNSNTDTSSHQQNRDDGTSDTDTGNGSGERDNGENTNFNDLDIRTSLEEDTLTIKIMSHGDMIHFYRLIRVKPGSYIMGGTSEQDQCATNPETKTVTVTREFFIGETEITEGLYQAVMEEQPIFGLTVDYDWMPRSISYNESLELCNKLTVITGIDFSLPSQIQWEYAARGGHKHPEQTKFPGSNEIDDVAWYKSNSDGVIHRVKGKLPNALHLYDMCGNLSELLSHGNGPHSYKNWRSDTDVIDGPVELGNSRFYLTIGGDYDDRYPISDCRDIHLSICCPLSFGVPYFRDLANPKIGIRLVAYQQ